MRYPEIIFGIRSKTTRQPFPIMKKFLALISLFVVVLLSASCQTTPKKDACCEQCAAAK